MKAIVKIQYIDSRVLVSSAIFAAAVFAGACTHAETKEQQARPVKVKAAESQIANRPARYAASITPDSQVEVAFKVGGYVVAVKQERDQNGELRHIQPGDIVRQGEVLAQLRRADYQAKVNQTLSQQGEANAGIETTKAQLAEATASIETSKAQLAESQAGLDRTKQDYERAKNLFNAQSITKADYDASKAQYESATARVDAARSQLATAQSRVKTAAAQIGASEARVKTAQAATADAMIPLGDTSLKAPMTSIVLERKVEVGALVTPNASGFLLADIANVKATFGVPDMALQDLKLGQPVRIKTEAVTDNPEFTGHISRVSPSADANSRVFEIEVTIRNPLNHLKPGMIVSLEVNEGSQQELTVVPLGAVARSKTNPQAYAVFVAEQSDGKTFARQREITLGETYGNNIAVTSGLKIGEQVVTTGVTLVMDGDLVQVIP